MNYDLLVLLFILMLTLFHIWAGEILQASSCVLLTCRPSFFFFFNFVQFIQLFLKVGCNWHKTLLVSAMQPNGSTFVYIIILPSYHSDSVLGSYCSSCRYSYFSKASWFLLMESGNKWHFCPFTCSGPKEISWFSLSLSILYSVFNPSATSNGSTFKIYPEYDYYYWLFLPLLS